MHRFLAPLSDSDKVRFALSYPFAQAPDSYIFADGRSYSLTAFDVEDWPAARILGDRDEMDLMEVLGPAHFADLTAERFPVLAVGSNGSPEQLARKYEGTHEVIPTVRVTVVDHAVCYAAHITGYGSFPATLHCEPGSTASLFVNFLTAAQRDQMHKTETLGRHYAYSTLEGVDIRLEDGTRLDHVSAYVAIQGVIARDDTALALAEIPQEVPSLVRATQTETADYVRGRLAPNLSREAFVLGQIYEESIRHAREEGMQAFTVPTRIARPHD